MAVTIQFKYGSAAPLTGDITTAEPAFDATNGILYTKDIAGDIVEIGRSFSGLTATVAELNTLDGITATVSELNTLDGITSTVDELNVLDGVTATTAEINYLDITTLGTSEPSKVVTADANGDVYVSEEFKAKSYTETYVGLSGTGISVNCEAGNYFGFTMSGNTTVTFNNPPASGTVYGMTIEITQDSLGSGYTIGWPAAVTWKNGVEPSLTNTSDAVDIFVFTTRDGGTTWRGFAAGTDMG